MILKNKFQKISFYLSVLFLCHSLFSQQKKQENFLKYVNPLMGTDSSFELSNGNTYPAIALPWGMNFWTPQTGKMGDGWGYQYTAKKIRGIKQTHQPSPWINDYGAFSLMAVTDTLHYEEEKRASWFSHKAEVVKPNYYSVYLADYDTTVEVTPTERAAIFRFTFPESQNAFIILDAFFKGSKVKILPEQQTIVGYSKNNSGGVPNNFRNYFVATFSKKFDEIFTWKNTNQLSNSSESESEHSGAVVKFSTQKGEQILVKVASSFISQEQAFRNLNTEIGEKSFETIQKEGEKIWNTQLGKIAVEDTNIDHLRTFYSSLYRVLLFPRRFYEFDNQNNIIHYSPYNGKIEKGYMYTDNGFWDTFRAVFPLFNLVYSQENKKIMEGLVNTYKESGWLPEWASPGHRDCMIGSNSASIIADAYLKGNISSENAEILLEALLKNASVEENRPVKSVGREGASYYNKLGYIPYNVGINENTARTLEYAYADFCISEMAKKMGKTNIAQHFEKQSKNYKNVFDPETHWARGKNEDGTFQSPFNPLKWGDAFTEGNSLHYSWSVFHDINGLIQMMGGKKAFETKIDEVFSMPPKFDHSYYGFTIHEIREMQLVNMGNYAHGNQPIQHLIYLYNFADAPHKTQQKIRQVLTKLYTPTPDGYCGDEDNGQTSAWYVFSAMGFYPVTPATPRYEIGSPLFKKITLFLNNNKKFIISAKNNSENRFLIKNKKLNGKFLNTHYLLYDDIQKGGTLSFEMMAPSF